MPCRPVYVPGVIPGVITLYLSWGVLIYEYLSSHYLLRVGSSRLIGMDLMIHFGKRFIEVGNAVFAMVHIPNQYMNRNNNTTRVYGYPRHLDQNCGIP